MVDGDHQVSPNLVWEAQIRQIALPDDNDRRNLTPEQEAHVVAVLFERLGTFLAEQEGATSA
ncbi:hypothetical protein AB0F91_16785 [Amycolatopsis sp. NPDC023774]|uniref:hypothetical protein n=1 Tax=Amycolatopsis sp. NPDC023774 TaxID=3155015 RepID=UPI0033FBEE65